VVYCGTRELDGFGFFIKAGSFDLRVVKIKWSLFEVGAD
jgi:hypothetical protein